MKIIKKSLFPLLIFCLLVITASGQSPAPFASSPLEQEGELSSMMVEGIHRFLDRKTVESINKRPKFWQADFSGHAAYNKSVGPNRERLARIIGAVDPRLEDINLEYISATSEPAKVAENQYFIAYAVRWPVFGNIHGEGLLLQPKTEVKARVIAIPDADQTPEMLIGTAPGLPSERQYARRLAENGCQVIIPTLINRSDTYSGSQSLDRYTNQPHREWIYRQAYTFGRHVIGYEVQKVLAAVDWLTSQNGFPAQIGVVGWGEGAMLGFYSAALDPRIDVALVSGYFSRRESLWEEPIYRNLSGFLREFGDAEVASLIIPRSLIIEYADYPEVKGPPPTRPGPSRLGASAAPGKISTPEFATVEAEVTRAKKLAGPFEPSIQLVHDNRQTAKPLEAGSLLIFMQRLQPDLKSLNPPGQVPVEIRPKFDPKERQRRQVQELERYTQQLIGKSRHVREEFFWENMQPITPEAWKEDKRHYQDYFWDVVIGRIPPGQMPLNPRSRQIFDKPTWTGYEVTLDVLPDVFAWGYLLLPKDIKPGEKRPVIVAQHGGSGLPASVMDETSVYKGFAVQLVERGFIVFAPHFPWRGEERYRDIQRKANPLGLSVFSVILNQHEALLDWLTQQPWVDPDRIGLYGLSWGGKVAMRVPALLDRYALAICSGDFNEWIWKNATTDWPNSYMFVPEYEMFDFNLGRTFNYGEMAALIAPRAFMVERGHSDGVGIDEWVAFEYAKVNRLYDQLGIPDKTEIEYFKGGHEINAAGTFEFIHRIFDWPEPGIAEK